MIVYYDSNALIYQTEVHPLFAARVKTKLDSIHNEHEAVRIATSRLSWLECRVLPLRSHDAEALDKFDRFFALPDLLIIEIERTVIERATEIRAQYNLTTPDAIHAASCLGLGGDHLLLTGDATYRRVPGLRVHVLV